MSIPVPETKSINPFENLSEIHDLNENIAALTSSRIFDRNSEEYMKYCHLLGKIIVIDGNISAGKTSLGCNIQCYLNNIGIPAKFLEEKFNKDMLSLFYSKIKEGTYTFTLQMDMLRQCQNVYQQAIMYTGRNGGKSHVVITDRTIWGNCVFAALHKTLGNILPEEYNTYLSALKADAPYVMDYIIYLDVSPNESYNRVHNIRKRESEKTIPLKYLQQLDFAYYGQIFNQMRSGQSNIFVLSNESFYDAQGVLDILVRENSRLKITPDQMIRPEEIKSNEELREAFSKLHY